MRFGLPQRSRLHQTEERGYAALVGAFVAIVIFGFLPIGVAVVIGLVQGTPEGELLAPGDGYPAFTVLSPLMTVPAVLLVLSLVVTFHLPLKASSGLNRSEIMYVALVGVGTHVAAMSLDRHFLSEGMTLFVLVVMLLYLAVLLVAALRIVAGWLRLVPATWRDEEARRVLTRSRAKRN